MTIEFVNPNLSVSQRIDELNKMILELNGLISNANFNLNELTQLFTDLGITRKYSRNIELGHTISTYTNWTHIISKTGYSIWKITPTNYSYDALNELYLNNEVLSNEGEADDELGSGNTVETLLALANSDIIAQNWAWCSYNNSIYVTIRNTGSTGFEGNLFITSSSSATNLQNFFISNNTFKINYESNLYASNLIATKTYADTNYTLDNEILLLVDCTDGTVVINLPEPSANKIYRIKKIDDHSANVCTITPSSGVTIDSASTYELLNQYESVSLISDGSNWYVF
jgi:hypothetical protein